MTSETKALDYAEACTDSLPPCSRCGHLYEEHATDEEMARAGLPHPDWGGRTCVWAFASSICTCEDYDDGAMSPPRRSCYGA